MNTIKFKTGKMTVLLSFGIGALTSAQGQQDGKNKILSNSNGLMQEMDSDKNKRLFKNPAKGL